MRDPKRPPSWTPWLRVNYSAHVGLLRSGAEVWKKKRLLVISSFAVMEFRGEQRPQFLISISDGDQWGGRRRATDAQVAVVLRAFGMVDAEEDNHKSGVSRCFFLLADRRPDEASVQCECKEGEEVVIESDGYAWSRSKESGELPAAARPPIGGWAERKLR